MNINQNKDKVKHICKNLKIILSGCKHISDAYDIGNMFKEKYPEYKKIINSIINGKVYENTMSIKNIYSVINDISLLTYKEDVIDLIDNICNEKNINETHKRTFLRTGAMKIFKPFIHTSNKKNIIQETDNYERKPCPHCGHICTVAKDTEYIICGYTDQNKGYDYQGCGKDWCFKCGKLLCKIWDHDSLFLLMNRHHNGECCKNHAKENNNDYKDYCQCINTHVNRNNVVYDFGISLKY
jgi:hypothetical protein